MGANAGDTAHGGSTGHGLVPQCRRQCRLLRLKHRRGVVGGSQLRRVMKIRSSYERNGGQSNLRMSSRTVDQWEGPTRMGSRVVDQWEGPTRE